MILLSGYTVAAKPDHSKLPFAILAVCPDPLASYNLAEFRFDINQILRAVAWQSWVIPNPGEIFRLTVIALGDRALRRAQCDALGRLARACLPFSILKGRADRAPEMKRR